MGVKSFYRNSDLVNIKLISNNLINQKDRVLISFSGGQDSIYLLFMLNQLYSQLELDLAFFWCHHLWQIDSFYLMHQVAKLSFLFQFNSCFAIPSNMISSELLARKWRKSCSYRVSLFYNYPKICLAHTSNDKVETVFFNFMRGTGLTGLSPLCWTQSISTHNIIKGKHISQHKHLKYLSSKTVGYWASKPLLALHPFSALRPFVDIPCKTLSPLRSVRALQRKECNKWTQSVRALQRKECKTFHYGNEENTSIVRPLLSTSRFEINKICYFWKLPIYPDKSNQKVKFFRNRVRQQLLPIIKLFFNSKIENILLQLAGIVEIENCCFTQIINEFTKNIDIYDTKPQIRTLFTSFDKKNSIKSKNSLINEVNIPRNGDELLTQLIEINRFTSKVSSFYVYSFLVSRPCKSFGYVVKGKERAFTRSTSKVELRSKAVGFLRNPLYWANKLPLVSHGNKGLRSSAFDPSFATPLCSTKMNFSLGKAKKFSFPTFTPAASQKNELRDNGFLFTNYAFLPLRPKECTDALCPLLRLNEFHSFSASQSKARTGEKGRFCYKCKGRFCYERTHNPKFGKTLVFDLSNLYISKLKKKSIFCFLPCIQKNKKIKTLYVAKKLLKIAELHPEGVAKLGLNENIKIISLSCEADPLCSVTANVFKTNLKSLPLYFLEIYLPMYLQVKEMLMVSSCFASEGKPTKSINFSTSFPCIFSLLSVLCFAKQRRNGIHVSGAKDSEQSSALQVAELLLATRWRSTVQNKKGCPSEANQRTFQPTPQLRKPFTPKGYGVQLRYSLEVKSKLLFSLARKQSRAISFLSFSAVRALRPKEWKQSKAEKSNFATFTDLLTSLIDQSETVALPSKTFTELMESKIEQLLIVGSPSLLSVLCKGSKAKQGQVLPLKTILLPAFYYLLPLMKHYYATDISFLSFGSAKMNFFSVSRVSQCEHWKKPRVAKGTYINLCNPNNINDISNSLWLDSLQNSKTKIKDLYFFKFFLYFFKFTPKKQKIYLPNPILCLPLTFQQRIVKLSLLNRNKKNIRYSKIENILIMSKFL